jgi:hypothetical protein
MWYAQGTGLWNELNQYMLQHGEAPIVEVGSAYDWFRLAYKTRSRIRRMKNQWKGETVVCVGNGPSINETDLSILDGAYVIGTNRAFHLLDRIKPASFLLMVQDNQRLAELEDAISSLQCKVLIGSWYFTPDSAPPKWIRRLKQNVAVYLPKLDWNCEGKKLRVNGSLLTRFSDDPTLGVYYSYSVVFSAIQFAKYFGASRIVCIGIDMDFSKGVSFQPQVRNVFPTFDYDLHGKPTFEMMKIVLDNYGVELINATPGGRVDAIPRLTLQQAMQSPRAA